MPLPRAYAQTCSSLCIRKRKVQGETREPVAWEKDIFMAFPLTSAPSEILSANTSVPTVAHAPRPQAATFRLLTHLAADQLFLSFLSLRLCVQQKTTKERQSKQNVQNIQTIHASPYLWGNASACKQRTIYRYSYKRKCKWILREKRLSHF